jgi:hypothetical protein
MPHFSLLLREVEFTTIERRQYRGRAALQRRVKKKIGKGTSSLVPHQRSTRNAALAAEAPSPGGIDGISPPAWFIGNVFSKDNKS